MPSATTRRRSATRCSTATRWSRTRCPTATRCSTTRSLSSSLGLLVPERRRARRSAARHLVGADGADPQLAERLVVGDPLPQGVGVLGPLDPAGLRAAVDERHGDEPDPLEADVLELQADLRHLLDVRDVGGQRLGGGVEEPHQPVEAGQRAAGEDLRDQRGDERLLPLDPADVAAVADAVANPHVGERLLAVQGPGAGRDGDAVLRAVDVLRHADLDAVDGVDHVLEAAEVDDDVVVDADAGGLLELLDRAGRAADRSRPRSTSRCVAPGMVSPSVARAVGTVDQGVARDGDAVRRLPVGREVEQERGVRPAAGLAGRCRSRRSHGSPSPSPGCSSAASAPRCGPSPAGSSSWSDDVDDVEVAVEVAVEEGHREAAHHAQRQQRRQQHLRHRVRPCGPVRGASRADMGTAARAGQSAAQRRASSPSHGIGG